ncbi:MAG: hypothetical protein WAM97_01320 [Acidimicrobiales bacterium]
MDQGSPRWSGQQAIFVAAGVVTILGFVFDRLAVLNDWLGEPWLGGITAGACLLVFGFGWRWLEGRWGPRPGKPLSPRAETIQASIGPWSLEAQKRLDGVTADTRIGDALLQFNSEIPKDILEITLGEMALMRRMAEVRHETIYDPFTGDEPTPRVRCEDVLIAAGAANPKRTMVRLLGAHMLYESEGECRCTKRALWAISTFTNLLTKDPFLVAAYRSVTPRISRTIKLDGTPPEG